VPLEFAVAAGTGEMEQNSTKPGLSEVRLHTAPIGYCGLVALGATGFIGFCQFQQEKSKDLTSRGSSRELEAEANEQSIGRL